MQEWKRALVVGASSGIGKAIAEQLLAAGVSTALVARRAAPMNEIAGKAPANVSAFVYEHDVTDYAATESLFQKITQDLGGLDVIVYASGVMPSVEENEYNFDKDKSMIDVNVLGAIAWLNEAAKRFERTKSGTIVGISSIAGDRGRRGNPAYCTSKAALTTYLESLRNRLSRFGVKVVTIKPGFIETDMVRGKPGLFWLISPEKASSLIIDAARSGRSTAYIPGKWRIVARVVKSIPSWLFKHLPV